MTTGYLKSLTIDNLRGCLTTFTLPFEKEKKLTIVYGENGTGKSTISDAFDLLGNGRVGSLEDRGVGGNTRVYWPSVGKVYNDVKVVLTTSAGACALTLGKANVIIDNEHHKPQVAVLRRSQILKLIAAQPADRYKEISHFIDVSEVEASEATLRKLITDKKKDYDSATTRVGANRTNIENFWKQIGSPLPDAFSWAKLEVQKNQQEFDSRKQAVDGLISCWDKVIAHPSKLETLTLNYKSAESLLVTAKNTVDEISENIADDHLDLLDLLKAAQKHFIIHSHPNVCPLCESAENVSNLIANVNNRIDAQSLHSKLIAAKQAADAQFQIVQRELQRKEDFLKEAENDFAALESYCNDTSEISDLEHPKFPVSREAEKWADWINANKALRDSWKKVADDCIDSKNFLETLRRSLSELEDSEAMAKDFEILLPRLEEILKVVEGERKKYTDAILADISTRVGELYEAIHPGEGLNKIALALDAKKRGSLDIATEFAGQQDAPPQAYFSDSHLDTLGFCVFTALAERDSPEKKILVLDDVLGSVDEPHVERIINLIYEVSQKFRHSIITTHYRPWKEKFRWGVLRPDQTCHFVELNQWGVINGMSLSGAIIPEISRLKTLLADPQPDTQSICSKAGVILEALLDFVTLQYGCAVPRRHGNAYVLSDLLNAVNGKLLSALKVELIDPDSGGQVIASTDLKPILDEITQLAQARNVLGAHFNAMAFDLYPADGIRFAQLVERLSDALVCPDHGRPMKDTGSYWRNGGDTRRLHPLKKPA